MNNSYIKKGTSCPRFTVSVADHRSTGRDIQEDSAALSCSSLLHATGRQFQACFLSLCCSEINMASSRLRSSKTGSLLSAKDTSFSHCGHVTYTPPLKARLQLREEGKCGYPYCHVVLPKSWKEAEQCGHRTEVNAAPGLCHLHLFSVWKHFLSNSRTKALKPALHQNARAQPSKPGS